MYYTKPTMTLLNNIIDYFCKKLMSPSIIFVKYE